MELSIVLNFVKLSIQQVNWPLLICLDWNAKGIDDRCLYLLGFKYNLKKIGGTHVLFVVPLIAVLGILVRSTLGFTWIPYLPAFLPACNRFLILTSGVKPADLSMTSIVAEPFWSKYLHMCINIGGSRTFDRVCPSTTIKVYSGKPILHVKQRTWGYLWLNCANTFAIKWIFHKCILFVWTN